MLPHGFGKDPIHKAAKKIHGAIQRAEQPYAAPPNAQIRTQAMFGKVNMPDARHTTCEGVLAGGTELIQTD